MIDGDVPGCGTTRGTTAVLTAQHSTLYSDLIAKRGEAAARRYLRANLRAAEQFRALSEKIPCNFETRPSCMYTCGTAAEYQPERLYREAQAVRVLGFPAEFVRDAGLPFQTCGAVVFPNMAQFHPLRFLHGIARGLHIFARTYAERIDLKTNTVHTSRGRIRAKKIVVATHFPFFNRRGLYFAKLYQTRSYVAALGHAPQLPYTYVGTGESSLYFRTAGDLLLVGGAYKDWTKIGGTTNFMTFGEFPGDERNLESRWFKPGVVFDRKLEALPFEPSKIEEHVRHSWYAGDAVHKPFQGVTEPKFTFMGDKDRYSWMKAPRYDGRAVETGPLAQVLVAYLKGNAEVVPVVDSVLQTLSLTPGDLFSTLGRTAARGIETAVIAKKTGEILQEYKENVASGDKKIVENCEVPDKGEGAGFVNAPRGGLSHWLVIENKKVANFQLVVPSTWNLGPRCSKGIPSAVEEALVNTPIADPKRPVEILRTVHSFDPCIACAVHVIDGRTNEVSKFQIL